MRLRHTMVVVLCAALLLAACGSSDEDEDAGGSVDDTETSTTTTESGPQWDKGVTDTEVRIGIHAPLKIGNLDVSDLVGFGSISETFWAYSNQNRKINGRSVKVELVNDGFDPGQAIQACRDLVTKEVFMISGTGGTDQIIVCAEHAASQGITYTSLGVADSLTDDPNYFAFTATYNMQARGAARLVMTRLDGKNKKIAVIKENTPNLDEAISTFVSEVEKLGGKVVARDVVGKPPTPEELTNECLKLKEAGVDIVYTWMPSFSLSSMAKQCDPQGFKPQYLGIANGGGCTVTGAFGTPLLEGCLAFSTNRNPDEVEAPIEEECQKGWEAARPGKELPEGGEQLCAFFDVLRKALEDAGRDLTQESFRKALRDLEYDNGILNPIKFDGQVASDQFVIIRAKGGKLVEEPAGFQPLEEIE